ncbi:glycosyltransferase family 4 protein [Arthrobacter sp. UYEF3]|uniref:glycosyltransferase family 4 protein n=1 Tax=Arthrobacter sp. UYEF3 TaxID=1756365 RepID=UPI003390ABBF
MNSSTRSPAVRILMAHPSGELYGSDRVFLESVEAMTSIGAAVTVTIPSHGPLVRELTARGADVVLHPTLVLRKNLMRPAGWPSLLLRSIAGTWHGWTLLNRLKPDALYVSTLTIPLWTIVGRSLRCPVLVHVHEAESKAVKPIRMLLNAPLLPASKVVCNSRYSAEVLAGAFPGLRRKASVIYNGVRGPDGPVPARVELEGKFRVLYVGRLSERKGVDVAVNAVRILIERGRPASLDIVGAVFEGYEWYEEELRRYVACNGLEHEVRFHGFDPDVWPHLMRADVAVVPSRGDEPFGNTAVEAVLAARPVVVSNTSGLREAAENYASAVFVEPGKPEDLADALQRVAEEWPSFRERAVQDAEAALERNGIVQYRTSLAAEMTGLIPAESVQQRVL